jgi:hypothetical protein
MRILFVIPHFFQESAANSINRSGRADAREERLRALVATLTAIHSLFGSRIYGLDHFNRTAWQMAPSVRHEIDIVVCTTKTAHLLDRLTSLGDLYRHHAIDIDPPMLGFECHKLMAEAKGRYDYYGYVEDDIIINDPLFFRKRRLFDRLFGPDALLQPNRYELKADGPIQRLYVDYHIRPSLTAPHQDVTEQPSLTMPFVDETILFERPSYPSSGCFFLNAEQLRTWSAGPHFLDGDTSYMSPMDSAVTLSIMKTFRIYKPVLDQASFLEVLHASPRWITSVGSQIKCTPRDLPFSPHRS